MSALPLASRRMQSRLTGIVGLTSNGNRVALGHNPQQLQPLRAKLGVKMLTPVTLPPGRLRLATRPSLTGSSPLAKTMGIVVVAALAASAEATPPRRQITATCGGPDQPPMPATGRLAVRPAVFDRDVLALDIAGFLQAMAERGD